MHIGSHATLGDALAAAMRVRIVVVDPQGGADLAGEIVGSVSRTHVNFRDDEGRTIVVAKVVLRIAVAPDLLMGDRA